jgi:hypothetical protein
LDGSRFGEHALPAAVALARPAGAQLRLVQVHLPLYVFPSDPAFYASTLFIESERETRRQERSYLESLTERLIRERDGPSSGVKPTSSS